LFSATAAVSCKALCKGFFNANCIAKIVSLVKKTTIVENQYFNGIETKQYSYFLFFLKKGMTDRVPVKGNCVDSGPSLVAETLSRLLLSYQTGYRMQNITILWVSTILVELEIPPAGGPQILSN